MAKANPTSKKLFLVESPTKAKTIREYLGNDFFVEASFGHVLDLPEKRLGILVSKNFTPEFEIPKTKSKVVKQIREKAKGVTEIYLGGDSDREGEAICHELKEILQKEKKVFYRVKFREISKEAIWNSLANKESINSNLVESQIARRILDRLVGYMISPILWEKISVQGLSAGRVQSVVLSWICKRELEIKNFTPEEYFTIDAQVETKDKIQFDMTLKKISGEIAEIKTKDHLEKILKDFSYEQDKKNTRDVFLKVQEVLKKKKIKNPPSPYNTSALQQDASQFLQFSPKKTMKVAQELYEGLNLGKFGKSGLVTYMRTDSRSVSLEAEKSRQKFIENKYGKDYISKNPQKKSGKEFAHEAIRPTDVWKNPESIKSFLNIDQLKLYKLIWERFVSSGMKPTEIENTTISADYKNYSFQFSCDKVLFRGFMEGFSFGKLKEFKDYDKIQVRKGDELKVVEITSEKKETNPPVRYTESSIIRKMEKTRIGRPSTYSTIFEILKKRKYIEIKKSYIFPTELGGVVDGVMVENFSDFTDEKFTAEMEKDLDRIESGELSRVKLLEKFYSPFSQALSKVKSGKNSKLENLKNPESLVQKENPCPLCGDGKLVQNLTRKKRLYYRCSRFPYCEFVSYEKP
ncbi:MAG: type I DNA topoisomerase [Leptospiraceae bacterium]|nr:type I DNA topoisomerase [Leptospiraceae bacterium]MCK6382016.1 type I DNA topoisomerase [Leptospiraceae bacterium]NUM40387.1 type I DNA topoisomerase [Leptospiraceae bacterium]